MTQNNKKATGTQPPATTTTALPTGNIQMNLNDLSPTTTGNESISKIVVNYIHKDSNMLNSNEV